MKVKKDGSAHIAEVDLLASSYCSFVDNRDNAIAYNAFIAGYHSNVDTEFIKKVALFVQNECAKVCDKSSHPALAILQLDIDNIIIDLTHLKR